MTLKIDSNTRRDFIKATAAGAAALTAGRAMAGDRKPNILLIVSDDHGFADVGVHGCRDVPTPHLDSIAEGGVRFTDGYVSCPVCSPSRAGFITGRYQQRFGHEFNNVYNQEPPPNFGLPLNQPTIAERLREQGYVSGCFGKWHLGFRPEMHPLKRGFDEFYGFIGGGHDYLDPQADPENPILDGTRPVNDGEYLTFQLAGRCASFIERHQARPFFSFLSFNAPHQPMQAPKKYLEKFEHIRDRKRRQFAAMLSAMDDAVGTTLKKLRELSLERDTLVVFFSDNGGFTEHNASRNKPFRGVKGQLLEGGIHVPFFMRWPGRIPEGTVDHRPVISLDVAPTAVAAAGGSPEKMGFDGANLLPFLGGKNKDPHEALFWRYGEQHAIRMGDYKYLELGDGKPQLYKLNTDPGERFNLALVMPDKVDDLQDAYKKWNQQNLSPLWEGKEGKKGKNKKSGEKGKDKKQKNKDTFDDDD